MHTQRHLWLCIKKRSAVHNTMQNWIFFKKIRISGYKSLYALYEKNVYIIFCNTVSVKAKRARDDDVLFHFLCIFFYFPMMTFL